jgi:hypothetical protein
VYTRGTRPKFFGDGERRGERGQGLDAWVTRTARSALRAVVRPPPGRVAGKPRRCVRCDDGPYHSNRP